HGLKREFANPGILSRFAKKRTWQSRVMFFASSTCVFDAAEVSSTYAELANLTFRPNTESSHSRRVAAVPVFDKNDGASSDHMLLQAVQNRCPIRACATHRQSSRYMLRWARTLRIFQQPKECPNKFRRSAGQGRLALKSPGGTCSGFP